jgi:hypothetical protein
MSEAVLRLKIVLVDTEPPIWRLVEVPAATRLGQLYTVIQAAMGGTTTTSISSIAAATPFPAPAPQ